ARGDRVDSAKPGRLSREERDTMTTKMTASKTAKKKTSNGAPPKQEAPRTLTVAEQAIEVVKGWGPDGAREIAVWHESFASTGKAALQETTGATLKEILRPNADQDDAAHLFAFISAGETPPAVLLATLRLCPPASVAPGMIRRAIPDNKGWKDEVLAMFRESESLAEAIHVELRVGVRQRAGM